MDNPPPLPAAFQPTLPVRGATGSTNDVIHLLTISTHAPRAGSDPGVGIGAEISQISTHAPRAGSDAGLA